MLAGDVCCKHIVTAQLFYRWRAKYGGMDVSAVERLKELARENAKLKKIVAERALDIRMLKRRKCKKILRLLKTTCGDHRRGIVDAARQTMVRRSERDYWG
jgi:putative transposase